jgi:hypothetical protein
MEAATPAILDWEFEAVRRKLGGAESPTGYTSDDHNTRLRREFLRAVEAQASAAARLESALTRYLGGGRVPD